MPIIIGLLVISFSVFNIYTAIKRKKKILAVLNGAFYAVIALVLILDNVNSAIITNDSENYSIYHGGILSSVRYDRTEGDYYIIKRSGILTYDEIAVPVKSADIPAVSEIYKPVMIYCKKDTELFDPKMTITVSSKEYNLANTVVEIKPNYSDLILSVGLIDLLILIIFNVVLFTVNIISLNLNKDKTDLLESERS